MNYLGSVVSSALSVIFIVFAISALGYLLGGIRVKGIALGTAGVLLVALIYGVCVSFIPDYGFSLGETKITLFVSSNYKLISNIGTAMFVTAVGLIAGPKFFRTFNKKSVAYIVIGVAIILSAGAIALLLKVLTGTDADMMTGLLTGALTSTPGLSAAKESADAAASDAVTAGYGIAYLFGVLGVVLFVQLIPRILKIDIPKEREHFVAACAVTVPAPKGKLFKLEPHGLFAFFFTIAAGVLIGAVRIPGINFSLGTSGGTLIAGLIVGHFAHIGRIDMTVPKETLNFMRELGLVLFLVGAGVPGGINFITAVKGAPLSILYGAILTLVPMIFGFILAKYVFKLSIFNCLGSITGGMTSTPALGALISTAGTDDVSSAYAATYPIALVVIVVMVKFLVKM
ncbi:MAG: YidE/YbjL duplication [Clostridia bacterium]|nr:YidE/YbjL duplication [Clostridia bacterium]